MSALIFIDPAAIHPVIDNVWHRTRLSGIPAPGQGITMLCGATAAAEFETLDKRRVNGAPTQCPYCDVAYRRSLGWTIPEGHPGLHPQPQRRRP
ncbi:hypothetical protein ATK30_6868 [Amycolatopsis echigonensis]|uniref:Uncharacterized protein n=1 Tax=Amycolatopsis echigonensis TaxID=2576905 RepID=A0A2N3WPX9_9PSEU|nr:hypothetical protein [Amycolatopsis niigatensis]PKV95935.1 hypothetical protein ATK30_6868 [Amycolatopsis niigatensis]